MHHLLPLFLWPLPFVLPALPHPRFPFRLLRCRVLLLPQRPSQSRLRWQHLPLPWHLPSQVAHRWRRRLLRPRPSALPLHPCRVLLRQRRCLALHALSLRRRPFASRRLLLPPARGRHYQGLPGKRFHQPVGGGLHPLLSASQKLRCRSRLHPLLRLPLHPSPWRMMKRKSRKAVVS